MEWELKYPKVTVQPLIRDISDHTPLLLDTGLPSQPKNTNMFKFELEWLFTKAFYDFGQPENGDQRVLSGYAGSCVSFIYGFSSVTPLFSDTLILGM
jgi:hypothetical protein